MCSHQYLEVKFDTTWLLGGTYYNEGNLRQNSITHAHTLARRHKLFCKLRKVPIICSVLLAPKQALCMKASFGDTVQYYSSRIQLTFF